MKFTFSLIILFFTCFSIQAQDQKRILDLFKNKQVDSLIANCDLPFKFNPGTEIDDDNVTSALVLQSKFQACFKRKYFDVFFKPGYKVIHGKSSIRIEVRSFNKEGDLESESTLMMEFRRSKDGKVKLYQVSLAG